MANHGVIFFKKLKQKDRNLFISVKNMLRSGKGKLHDNLPIYKDKWSSELFPYHGTYVILKYNKTQKSKIFHSIQKFPQYLFCEITNTWVNFTAYFSEMK